MLETRPPRQNAGGQDQPQAAAPPQPGAIPQLQPFGGPPGAQPAAPGFLARWLGIAGAAPPIVPGQFAPGPAGFNPGAPNQPQFQQQGFPGQNPFGPWQQPGFYAPAQQAPAPVQVLQGFYIGNQWQPWGAPAPLLQQRQVRPQAQAPGAPPPSQNIPSPTPTVQPVANSGENNSQTPPQPSGAPSTTSQNGVSGLRGSIPPPSPDNAASLAALRRARLLNSVPPSPPHVTNAPTAMTNDQHGTAGAMPGQPPSQTPRASPAQTPTPTSGGSTSSPASGSRPPSATMNSQSRPARAPVPSLIPLFDPAITAATIVAPPGYHRMPAQGQYTPYPNINSQAFNQQRLRPRADPGPLVPELMRSSSNAQDLRSLPQTLTQEQLDRLDVTTREAIDERLRVLENVNGALWRCMEELARVRTVLPSPSRRNEPPSSQAQQPSQESLSNPEKVDNAPDDKGKTKAESAASSSTTTTATIITPSPSLSSSPSTDSPAINPLPVSDTPTALNVGPQPVENNASAIVAEVFEGVAEPAE